MAHELIKDQVVDYLDGRLSRNALAELETHLKACRACRQYYDEMRAVFSQEAWETATPSPDPYLPARVRALVAVSRKKTRFRLLRGAFATAGVGAAVFVGVFLGGGFTGTATTNDTTTLVSEYGSALSPSGFADGYEYVLNDTEATE